MDGSRRAGAMLALLAALLFVLLTAPSHAEPLADLAAPAAASAHHPGDGDPDAAHHAPGAHCGAHCAGHAAPPLLAMSAIDAGALAAGRQRPADDADPATVSSAPPTRPPSAA
ncbi:MAG: hypothetical protein KA098_00785 [Phenylobacterium sp.]|nr:hypothetical protein [Phenylobacterium sp.]